MKISRQDRTAGEIAAIIEHFVYRGPSGQQRQYDLEWYDLLDCGVSDPVLNAILKKCELINRQYLPEGDLSEAAKVKREQDADEALKIIAIQLREIEKEKSKASEH